MNGPFPRRLVGSSGSRRERGIVLFVALIVLVVMALAGIAMMRQSGSGVSISGNLAFKQNATNVADIGTEAARTWILAQSAATLSADNAPIGYYSSWGGSSDVDPMSLNWANSTQATANDGTGNQVLYIIHRLCEFANVAANSPAQHCADASADGSGVSHGSTGTEYPGGIGTAVAQPYFRISSQVTGPKNTVSYIQVIMQ